MRFALESGEKSTFTVGAEVGHFCPLTTTSWHTGAIWTSDKFWLKVQTRRKEVRTSEVGQLSSVQVPSRA